MTSQHFSDGWDNWDDWNLNENNGNNNNTKPQNSQQQQQHQQISQQNQQYVQQQQPSSSTQINAPIFSPFAYQQPSLNAAAVNMSNSLTTQSAFVTSTQQQQQPMLYGNPSNFFNNAAPVQHYGDSNIMNNNQIHSNQQQQHSTPPLINSPFSYQQKQPSIDEMLPPPQQTARYDYSETSNSNNNNNINNSGSISSLPISQLNQQQQIHQQPQPIMNAPSYSPSSFAFQQQQQQHSFDDLLPPPPLPQVSTAPTIDRHSYLVTGQLFQESSRSYNQQHQQQIHQNAQEQSFNEILPPPPGLARLVVGEPESESNQQQQQAAAVSNRSDVLPPGLNRLVTGTETTQSSFMSYQRQADGEVSSNAAPVRPSSSFNQQQQPLQHQINNIENEQDQNFNISDRNLYLVAGESNGNNQRVIPGVENDSSINAPSNLINPLQNLHIEDDEDFVNISVSSSAQHRNVDGDGMEEQQQQHQQQQQLQLSIDNEQREEDIEGANDNSNIVVNPLPIISAHENIILPPVAAAANEPESDVREDIEGANDDPPKLQPQLQQQFNENQQEKKKSIDSAAKKSQNITMSSEDSELRELEKNARSKVRRSKKHDDSNENDSESDDGEKVRNKYDNRYKRSSRERGSRDDYEKSKRKEKERRSGGRSKKNDDTDGSRYGDTRRRTDDDEEDSRRKNRHRIRARKEGEIEGSEEKDRKKEKSRDSRKKDYYDDDRRRIRDRERYYNEVYSSGVRSQNTSDREFDHYSTRPPRTAYEHQRYYQQPPYGYDSNYNYNSYYQQQQYFETLRRTNPQAYEWYKTYYGGMMQQVQMPQPSTIDVTESLRSGYNSSNEKDRASTSRFLPGGNLSNPLGSLNASFIDGTNEYQSLQTSYQIAGAAGGSRAYSSLNLNNQNYGYEIYGDSRAKTMNIAPSRMTPQKFQCIHGFVRLTNGLMATINTLSTDEKYEVKIENIPIYDRTRRLYQTYPGPLVRGVSHKKTIIEFCEEKLKQNVQLDNGLRSSYALLWSYLILMLRQNGTYTEADISELLMKNADDYRSPNDNNNSNNNNSNDDENETDISESEENVTSERNSNVVSHQSQDASTSIQTEKNVLDKFKSYLLYGNINDALDYATDNNLWGHALFLASKVDRRQHANVMLKFANKLPYNDPLQTLYQIMSGRMPACVTNVDDKFGDWKPHLAMIISNCTDKPELVKRSVMTLGDTLASRGDIFGSQFCYLLMDPQFTDYWDTTMSNGKIALLGTTLQKPFKEFASNDSIIMTEVYEYARSLSSENYFIASLQKYKFYFASNILDYGNQLKCLLYMEQISKCIVQQAELFDANFIGNVYSLADRLKFYDPVMEKSYEDNFNNNESIEDPKWLQDLAFVLHNKSSYDQQNIQQAQIYTTDAYNQQQQQHQISPVVNDPMSQHQTPTHIPSLVSNNTYEESDSHQYNRDQQNYSLNSQVPVTTYQNNNQDAFYSNQYQQHENQQQHQNNSYSLNGTLSNEVNDKEQQNYMQPAYDPNYQQQQQQLDYNNYSWDQPKPTITLGNAVSNKFDETSTQNKNEQVGKNKEDKNSPAKKTEEKTKKAAGQDSKSSSGWFSGLFFGKPKNQMILPDDKNPSILWDESTKKWVNKDEDTAETESFKPPPKMGNLAAPQLVQEMQQQQHQQQSYGIQQQQPLITQQQQPLITQQQPIIAHQQQQQQQPMTNPSPMQNATAMPQSTSQQIIQNSEEQAIAAASPLSSTPNMFKMQKGRNLKKSYVDILGNAGHTVSQPKELAPQMDMQFFNPQSQPQGMQFYNPNDFQ